MTRILISVLLLALSFSFDGLSQDKSGKVLRHKWRPVRVTSYTDRVEGAEAKKNLDAFEAFLKAEMAAKDDRYKKDIINGMWFYAISHNWSFPEETDFKLPPYHGQAVTPMSQRTADLLMEAWNHYQGKIGEEHPSLRAALDSAMQRIIGKSIDQ